MVCFNVECDVSRHKKPASWSFTFDENDELVSADALAEQVKAEAEAKKAEEKEEDKMKKLEKVQALVHDYLLKHGLKAKRSELCNYLMPTMSIGRSKAYDLLAQLQEEHLVPFENDVFYIANEPSPEPPSPEKSFYDELFEDAADADDYSDIPSQERLEEIGSIDEEF